MTREIIFKLKKSNIDFYTKLIIELGLLRKRNECAICFKQIKIKDYHIQLCEKCRETYLARKEVSKWQVKTNKHKSW